MEEEKREEDLQNLFVRLTHLYYKKAFALVKDFGIHKRFWDPSETGAFGRSGVLPGGNQSERDFPGAQDQPAYSCCFY